METRPGTGLLGAILAGGRSTRMGTNKAHVVVDGRAMAESVRAALAAVCDGVVVVGGPDADISDSHEGPLGAVAALLHSGRATRYLVAPVDQPRLTPSMLRRLLVAAVDLDDRSDGTAGNGFAFIGEPLPLLVDASAATRLDAALARGERRLRIAVTVEVDVGDDADALVNVNTPADVLALVASPVTGRGPRA